MAERKDDNAIALHNEQAALFHDRYRLMEQNYYQTTFTYGRKKVNDLIQDVLTSFPPPRDVLDIGCGTGRAIQELTTQGYHCTGLEPAQDMAAIARQENPGVSIEQAEATRLPFEDERFDLVMAIEVLRYIRENAACIAEMFRVLKSGGVCIVTVAPLLSTHGYAVFNRLAAAFRIPGFVHVIQYFETIGSISRKFRAAGFDEVHVRGCFFGPFVWLSKIAPKPFMARLLKWYEPIDDALTRLTWLHNFSNHLVVVARKNPPV